VLLTSLKTALAVVCGAVLLTGASGLARETSAPSLDGVRPSYRGQTWRMSGRLITPDGNAFSYAATFFRYAEPHGVVLYPASISVIDESSGRLFSERRMENSRLGLGAATTGALAVRVGTWRLSEASAGIAGPSFDLDAKLDGLALRVRGVASKPRFTLRSGNAEHDEYSSLASSGTIVFAGRHVRVRGKSWLDHELSRTAPQTVTPVAEFRVQLDDGREIYIETGSARARVAARSAYLIERDGSVDTLGSNSYEFGEHPGSTWLSPHTGTRYPDIWGLHVDGKTEFLSLEPVAYDQESRARGDGRSYWDGGVDVYDVTPGSQGLRLGSGYVLMHDYPQGPNDS
jgi:predicted secreted hydrolase